MDEELNLKMEKSNDTYLKQFVTDTNYLGENAVPPPDDVLISAWTSNSIIFLGLIGN